MLGHLVSNAGHGAPMADHRPGWLSRLLAFFFGRKA